MPHIQPAAINPVTDLNRDYVLKQLQAQRAQQMADMLTDQGNQSIQYDQRGAISPLQGLAKMLQTYTGTKLSQDAMTKQADVRALGANLMAEANGKLTAEQQAAASAAQAQPVASFPPDTAQGFTPSADKIAPAQPTPQALAGALQPGNKTPLNPYGAPWQLSSMASTGDPAATENLKTWLKNNELTPEIKNSRDPVIGGSVVGNLRTQNMTNTQKLADALSGAQPGSPLAKSLQAGIDKETYIAPVETKPGAAMLDPRTMKPVLFAPKTADGIGLDFTNPLNPTAHQVPGYAGANAAIQGAEQAAKQANTVFTGVQGPDGAPVAGYGDKLFGGQGGAGGGQSGATWTGGQLPPQKLDQLKAGVAARNPDAIAALDAYNKASGGDQRPGLIKGADPTIQTARTNQQNDLAAKWKPLNEAVSNSQTINGRLDTIKDLATKATTGQFSDRMQFVNSLLVMAGSDKAKDDITAKALLDKNANQIVAQLGQGGLATDAAREIIKSAYPNSHMPKEAIAEASDNLKAANQMQVAKAGILQRHYLNNDPAAYQQAETEFNAVADPRIFQWKAMASNPQAQAAYAKKLMAQDPSIADRIHKLDQMGAFK